MKCLICNTEIKKGVKKCPVCGCFVSNRIPNDLKKEDIFSDKKELDKDKYDTIVLLQDQLDSIKKLLDEDEKKEQTSNKKTKGSNQKKKKNNAKKEDVDSNTIILLKDQLNSIKELLDEDEKKEKNKNIKRSNNKNSNNRKKDVLSSVDVEKINSEKELKKNIAEISKELGEVNKEIEENKELIDLIRNEEQSKINSVEKESSKVVDNKPVPHDIEDKILMTAPIDKLADAIVGEIVDGINSQSEHNEVELKLKSKDDDLDKTKDFDLGLEKTIAISSLGDTKELDKFSLLDDINRQIDEVNEKATEDVVVRVEEPPNEINYIENKTELNDETIGTRKKIFLFTGIAVLVLVFTLMAIWLVTRPNHGNNPSKVDSLTQLNAAMQEYYESADIDEILYVLEEVKNDKEEVKKLQAKTRTICDSWVLLYLNEEVENKESFEKATTKYKGLLEGLYRYAIVKNDTNLVRALTEKDYNDLLIQFDNIYSDSSVFYEALELYNSKEYNKAYYMFERIESTNSYYDKSVTYIKRIESDILSAIKKDINVLEKNVETLDDAGKLELYSQIEQIIIDYNSVYSNIDLARNKNYQELLSVYTSKVSEYTDKVINGNNSQGNVT